jgi:hypothetical protein
METIEVLEEKEVRGVKVRVMRVYHEGYDEVLISIDDAIKANGINSCADLMKDAGWKAEMDCLMGKYCPEEVSWQDAKRVAI